MKTRHYIFILAACGCLAAIGVRANAEEKSATAFQIKDLKTASEADKLKSLSELAALGPKAADAIKYTEDLCKDPSAKVRVHAVLALGAIGPAAKDSAPVLAALLQDPDIAVRRAVIHALRSIRPGPKVMLPLVTKMMEESDPALCAGAQRRGRRRRRRRAGPDRGFEEREGRFLGADHPPRHRPGGQRRDPGDHRDVERQAA